MRAWRLIVLLLLLATGAAGLWYAKSHLPDAGQSGTAQADQQVAYDYEAHEVVLRQMDPDGRLSFQVEAREITQLPASGRMVAKTLTLFHDPPGTVVGGANRWTLTADSGDLPALGGVVTLSGHVRAHGLPVGGRSPISIATEHLRYDMTKQELSSDVPVQMDWGGKKMRCDKVQANIATGAVTLEFCNATIGP
jgi:LPS export ABC transporter protein LptC